MKNLRLILFFTGMAIELVALMGEHAAEIPFVMRIVAPSYYDGNIGIQKLEQGATLTQTDKGIRTIEKLLIKSYLEDVSTNWNRPIPKDLSEPLFISKVWTVSSASLNGQRQGVRISFTMQSKTGRLPVYHGDKTFNTPLLDSLKSEVEELKEPNILIFCFGMFAFGCVLEIIAFFWESSESQHESNGGKESGVHSETNQTAPVI